jgi:isocitrate dehydrogenase
MGENDFRSNEKSITFLQLRPERQRSSLTAPTAEIVLKDDWPLEDGDVIDATYMSVKALSTFLPEIEDAKARASCFRCT